MNLPNLLTLLRIFLVPVFMLILLIRIPYGEYIAAGIFILAASTDGLDGYIARSRHQVTRFGKLMDPLADKLLVSAALISLVELQQISAWIAVIIIGREFAVSGLRSVAAAEGVIIAASKLGKAKTITQIVAITVILLNDFPFSLISFPIGEAAMMVAVAFTVISGIDYFIKAKKTLRLYME
ncbi:MAG: CDP-diacylglycerol--glycerol-3-phosphate 3-phosphatidyltransferase [Firmicutes bacterium]|nr:CDP-diacylglycerol--glycerol-3-phosphate 3-phosphatidyltransferase [Bacillota bacterium]